MILLLTRYSGLRSCLFPPLQLASHPHRHKKKKIFFLRDGGVEGMNFFLAVPKKFQECVHAQIYIICLLINLYFNHL